MSITLKQRILRILEEEGSCTVSDLTKRVKVSPSRLRRVIQELKREGRIKIKEVKQAGGRRIVIEYINPAEIIDNLFKGKNIPPCITCSRAEVCSKVCGKLFKWLIEQYEKEIKLKAK